MKRVLDLFFSIALLIVLFPIMLLVALLVKATSRGGSALYWSNRVGRENQIFPMPKFRTMHVNAPQVATHLLNDSQSYLIPIGGFLRKSSLDELPQLWSILKGDMSFVGPRPALFNQEDLISMRSDKGVHKLRPGLTGWAQINGRDELEISKKVEFDQFYLENQSFFLDLKVVFLTIKSVVARSGVSH